MQVTGVSPVNVWVLPLVFFHAGVIKVFKAAGIRLSSGFPLVFIVLIVLRISSSW